MRSSTDVPRDLPLELSFPNLFEDLDEQQLELICDNNALDLVLIENATDLFRDIFQRGDNMEKALRVIVNSIDDDDLTFARSETFPFYVTGELKKDHYMKNELASTSPETREKYRRLVARYRAMIDDLKNSFYKIVTILAVDLEEEGGHYGAFIYNRGEVQVFDSMQTRPLGDEPYSPYFRQLAKDVFRVSSNKITVPDCIAEELSLQFTGGFSGYHPFPVLKAYEQLGPDKVHALSIQSTESQNHFCYIWALWYIHLRLLNYKFTKILDLVERGLDPLIIIKRYAYCLFYGLGLNVELGIFEEFFKTHFLAIWANVPYNDKLSLRFGRYFIGEPRNCKNITNAFRQSVTFINPIRVDTTPTPEGLCGL